MEHETTEQDSSCLPEPLTRRNADGDIYRRLATVDRQIQDALGLNPEELLRLSAVRDENAPGFLREESLVYLIRHYHRVGNRPVVNDLSECLLTRCATLIDGWLNRLSVDCKKEAYADVVQELFCRILDLQSDYGDFLQVRFWMALKRLTAQGFRRQVKLQRRHPPLTSPPGYSGEESSLSTRGTVVREPGESAARSVEAQVIEESVIREALSQLEGPSLSAYLLRYYYEWPIEDQDPTVQTISRRFGKTPRTIRNWLARAEESLATWRGEQS